jgi:hypothetical protein
VGQGVAGALDPEEMDLFPKAGMMTDVEPSSISGLSAAREQWNFED